MSEARLANFSSLSEITDNTSGFSSNSFNCLDSNSFVSDCTYFFLSNSARANGDCEVSALLNDTINCVSGLSPLSIKLEYNSTSEISSASDFPYKS